MVGMANLNTNQESPIRFSNDTLTFQSALHTSPHIPVQYPYNTHTIPVQYPYNTRTIIIPVQYPTMPIQYLYNTNTIPIQYLYNIRTIPVQYPRIIVNPIISHKANPNSKHMRGDLKNWTSIQAAVLILHHQFSTLASLSFQL